MQNKNILKIVLLLTTGQHICDATQSVNSTTTIHKVNPTTTNGYNTTTNTKQASFTTGGNTAVATLRERLEQLDKLEDVAKLGVAPERLKTRRKAKDKSTSSSSSDRESDKSKGKESLGMTDSSESSQSKQNHGRPKKSKERKGWRVWHRKCHPCPERDAKWRDTGFQWICGAYQRARRTFKSQCMMHFRNCQDGTMFVKIHDHKCKEDEYHGKTFFYSEQSSRSSSGSSSLSSSSDSKSYSDESDGDRGGDGDGDDDDDESRRKRKMKKEMHKFILSD